MPISNFVKFYAFPENLGKAKIDFSTHVFKVAFTNTAPALTNAILADITQIATTGGYINGGYLLDGVIWSASVGVGKLVITDEVITATGGSVGPFRFFVIYDDTDPNDILIGYYDYGSSVTLADTESFALDFDGANGVWTLT